MLDFHDTKSYESLRAVRRNAVSLLEQFSEAQLTTIPEGYNNHILWNVGHMLTSQQLLCYAMADQPLHIPAHYPGLFRKGTNPREWTESVDIGELKALLASTIGLLEKDYRQGLFKNYKLYTTSFGVPLASIEDAILFDHVHESVHFGIAMALRKRI